MKPQAPQAPKRFLRRRDVRLRTGLSDTTIFNQMRAGLFPRSILITPRCAVWDEADIDSWMASRKTTCVHMAPVPEPRRRVAA